MHSNDALFRWWRLQVSRSIFLFLGFAVSAFAADVQPLFSPVPQTKAAADTLKSQQAERTVSRVKLVAVDFRRVDANSGAAADAISIDAFDGQTLVLDKERLEQRSAGNYTWYGTVRGYPKGRAILTVVDGHMAGSIVLLDESLQSHGLYEIVPTANGMHALQEKNQSAYQTEEPAHRHAPGGLKDATEKPNSGKDGAGTIDIMVVYSNQTGAAAGGAIGAQIQASIDNTNQVYANSGISQRLRLVHAEQLNYNEHGSDVYGTALDDLTGTSDGQIDNVHSLRNTYGADLVSMFIENGSYCGIGWIGSSASYAFSVINRGCAVSNGTLAHELGHNMGAMHDPYQVAVGGEGTGPYTFGYGFVSLPGRFRDIMAYDSQCQANGFSCTRIPYLSNPNITYSGYPIGSQQSDPTPTSNVARVLNTTASTIANFRQSVITPPPPPPSPSPSGTTMPPATSIVDAAGGVWTFGSAAPPYGNAILLNGGSAGGGMANLVEYFNGAIYAENSNGWWRWTGTAWTLTTNPNAAVTPSANGTTMPPAASIVDVGGGVWTFGGATPPYGNAILLNGGSAGGGMANLVELLNGVIYAQNSNGWWRWTGSAWSLTENPNPVTTPSANGATIPPSSNIVDSSLAVWTLGSAAPPYGYNILVNGNSAGGGRADLVEYYNGNVYARNSVGWWRWTGASWAAVSNPNSSPDGATMPPTNSLTDAYGAVWTLGSAAPPYGYNLIVNGASAAGGRADLVEYVNGNIYAQNSTGWWWWTGSGWLVTTNPNVSANSATVPPSASIIDSSGGVWTLGSSAPPYGYFILLNGNSAASGRADLIKYVNGGIFVQNSVGWWRWTGGSWQLTSAPAPNEAVESQIIATPERHSIPGMRSH